MSSAQSVGRRGRNPDFRDLLQGLSDAGVRYLVVGAHAVAFYTEPRYTKDLDVWVAPTPENAEKVWKALAAYGAPMTDLTIADLCNPEMIYQMGVPPNRIDVMMGIEGLTFAAAWKRRKRSSFLGVPVSYIGLDDLIRVKRAAGRPQDRLDAVRLAEGRRRRTKKRR
jgi:predicted nucleotidyltransferase